METTDLTYDAAISRVQSILEEISESDLTFEQVKRSLNEAYDCLHFCRCELHGLRNRSVEFSRTWNVEEGERNE